MSGIRKLIWPIFIHIPEDKGKKDIPDKDYRSDLQKSFSKPLKVGNRIFNIHSHVWNFIERLENQGKKITIITNKKIQTFPVWYGNEPKMICDDCWDKLNKDVISVGPGSARVEGGFCDFCETIYLTDHLIQKLGLSLWKKMYHQPASALDRKSVV